MWHLSLDAEDKALGKYNLQSIIIETLCIGWIEQ